MSDVLARAPVLIVLIFAFGASITSVLGAVPYLFRDEIDERWIGSAEALAGGFMLGAGFLLLISGTDSGWRAILGAGIGVGFVFSLQKFFGFEEPGAMNEQQQVAHGYRTMLDNSVHSGLEGVAIGTAMVVDPGLGIFLAIALALHNIAESVVLAKMLRERGLGLKYAAGLCVMVKLPQMLTAVAVFAVVSTLPGTLHWTLGFAAGSLFYTILTDLLPEAYQRCGKTRVAVLISSSAGLVVLAQGMVG